MPFKSKAQMRFFYAKYREGKISKKELEEMKKKTKRIYALPERVKKK